MLLAGVDIGGTKCAVVLGRPLGESVRILGKRRFATPPGPQLALEQICQALQELVAEQDGEQPAAVGVSCGGPLDSRQGLVLSPPNLPGWDRVDALAPLHRITGAPAALQNDANAGALAEWRWGAGRGASSMIYLTFGTGMGAGLILNGRLYEGASGLAGEVGHLRLEDDGPVGYGKAGSLEGFCSGGGIALQGQAAAQEALSQGEPLSWCPAQEDLERVDAGVLAQAARAGDPLALQVWEQVGRQLGRGLAILVDLLNPERIVIGSIYHRQRSLLELAALQTLRQEALPAALAACQILPAALGESTGDLAALAVALDILD
jgi:glucokinase